MTIADRLINKMIQHNIIKKEDEEIYQFGLEGLILKLFHYSTYLLIAILFKAVFEFILFFIAFLILRKNAGGYHAKTKTGCYLLSCLTIIGVIFLDRFILGMNLSNLEIKIGFVLLLVADIFIWCVAPLGNRNRILEDKEIEYYRKITRIVLTVENVTVLLLAWKHGESYTIPIFLAIWTQAIILLIEEIRKKLSKYL